MLGLHPRTRPLALAWVVLLVGVLAQVAIGGCAPHPEASEELDELDELDGMPARRLGERSDQVHAPLALTATDGTDLRLSSIRAQAVIDGPLAFTELHLVFDNAEDRAIEGRFRIELPPRAAISRFAMKIGGAWQEGEVVGRTAARVVYEDFLHRRQDPALLEHEAGNTFAARVFPIAPGERKELIVSYSQELPSATEPYRLGLRGLPRLDDFSARVLRRDAEPVLVAERNWIAEQDLVVPTGGREEPIALRHGHLAVARVRAKVDDDVQPLGEVTVLFDTSASRALGFDTRIHRLGDLVSALLEQHEDDFPLRVIAFDQATAPIYDGMASELGLAELDAIAAGRALGASDLAGALAATAEDADGVDRIVVLTDGLATAGDIETAGLREAAARLAHAGVDRLDVVLDGGSHDETRMRAIVSALPDAGVVIDAELPPHAIADKLLRTTLATLDVSVPGSRWVWPTTLEGVQSGDDVLVYADLETDAPMRVQLGGGAAILPAETAAERPLLERAWVRANIERLQTQRSELPRESAARPALEREIVALSTRFRVLSELTALLVLETEDDYRRYEIARRAVADILVVGERGATLMHRGTPAPPPEHGFERGSDQHATSAEIGVPHFMARSSDAYGMAYAVGNDDEDVWGNLTGTEIGESAGTSGLGLVGTGRGGGGDGAVGLTGIGLVDDGESSRGTRRRIPTPRVRLGKVEVKGELERDLVRRIARAHLTEIRSCYQQGLVRDPSARGRVVVQFSISPTGRVPMAVVAEMTIADARVGQCMARAVRRWRFPKRDGDANAIVSYPFTLDSDASRRAEPAIRPRPVPPSRPEPIALGPARLVGAGSAAHDGPFSDVMAALAEGRRSDALATTLAWRERDAGDVLALVALGEVAEAVGDPATAARAYGSIIDLHPARADLRRWAGARLERLGAPGLELAIDTYAKALESRADHPSSHRMLALATLRAGRHAEAFDTLRTALASPAIPWDRFPRVQDILRDDLAIVGAAWIARDPSVRRDVERRLARLDLAPARTPSARFVLSWETDANDVDFHIEDARGGHASYANRQLPSGGELFADITTGYGPECFAIDGRPQAGPYRLSAHYFSQGPMGFGMGTLQIVAHDGKGGVRLDDRPFVIMKSGARVDLGSWSPD